MLHVELLAESTNSLETTDMLVAILFRYTVTTRAICTSIILNSTTCSFYAFYIEMLLSVIEEAGLYLSNI